MTEIPKNIIHVSYSHIRRWEVIASVTLISTLLVMGIYYLHPMNSNWYKDENFSFTNLLQFVFIDQFLFELITTFILVYLIGYYAKLLKINAVSLNLKGLLIYFFKFIPLYLLAYFFATPITVSIRFLYHSYITQQVELNYWNSYFFLNKDLYLAYILPLALVITLLLVIAFLRSRNTLEKNNVVDTPKEIKVISLQVKTELGEKIIPSNTVAWIFKEGRKYFVKTINSEKFEIKKNLTVLQSELDINFVLINRATLINLDYFEDYSFWENEKYVIRMTDGTEFQSTRERIKYLKETIDSYNGYN